MIDFLGSVLDYGQLFLAANFSAIAIVVLADWLAVRRRGVLGRRALRGLLHLAHRPTWQGALIAALVSLGASLTVFAVRGESLPNEFDEHGHILLGETLLQGRFANPAHPFWVHFETFSEVVQPRYVSFYSPANGAIIALGDLALGVRTAGFWLVGAAAAAATVWAARAWLTPAWSLVAGLLAALHPTFSFWNNTYHGGGVAALAAALLLGATARLCRRPTTGMLAVAAVAIVLLANSRPYEGLVLIAACSIFILQTNARAVPAMLRRIAAPLVILAAGALFVGTYNRSVTGSPFTLPHSLFDRQYNPAPHFLWQVLWQEPKPALVYRHPEIWREYGFYYARHYTRIRQSGGLARLMRDKVQDVFHAGAPKPTVRRSVVGSGYLLMLLPFVLLPISLRRRRTRRLALLVSISMMSGFITTWAVLPQYLGPSAIPVVVLYTLLLRELGARWPRRGAMLAVAVIVFGLALGVNEVIARARQPQPRIESERRSIVTRLQTIPGDDLIFVPPEVKYCVFNSADIDGSPVVWAREVDPRSDAALRRYYAGRKVWRLSQSTGHLTVTPF